MDCSLSGCPWDSPSKNIRVGCYFPLQRIFPVQEMNLGLLHCRQILYWLRYLPANIYSESFKSNEENVTLTDKAKDGLVLCLLSSFLMTLVLWEVFYRRAQVFGSLASLSKQFGRIPYSNKFNLTSVRIIFLSFLPIVTGHGLFF